MPEKEEFELLPHKEVQRLKQEIKQLKKNPALDQEAAQNMFKSMEDLTDALNMMSTLFKEASEEMKLEEREAEVVANRIKPIEKKMEQILDENQKIAMGVVALADLVNEVKDKLNEMDTKQGAGAKPKSTFSPSSQSGKEMPPPPPLNK